MRTATFLCAFITLFAGCESPARNTQVVAQRQWYALHNRMSVKSLPDLRIAKPQRLTQPQITRLKQVSENALSAVVKIVTRPAIDNQQKCKSQTARTISSPLAGTGVIISKKGLILTNEHVVRQPDLLSVILHNGREYPVLRVATDSKLDLAIVSIDLSDGKALHPVIQSLQPAQPVVAVSFDSEERINLIRPGMVMRTGCSMQRELDPSCRKDYNRLVETNAALEPGFSGSPLLDLSGFFVGINTAISGKEDHHSLRSYTLPFDSQSIETIERLIAAVSTEMAIRSP